MRKKNPDAVRLGRRGGKAGTGEAKLRGDKDYYSRIGKLSAAARRRRRNRLRPKKV